MYYISKAWQHTKLICGNHGDDLTHEMRLEETGKTLTYICPNFTEETRKKGECTCNNKITLYDFEKMLDKVASTIIKADMKNEIIHLDNFTWKNNQGISYKVIKHAPEEIIVTVLNPKALEKSK